MVIIDEFLARELHSGTLGPSHYFVLANNRPGFAIPLIWKIANRLPLTFRAAR